MELNAYKTEKVTVTVNEDEIFKQLEYRLRHRYRLFNDYHVNKEGRLIETVDMEGRGSDFEKDHGEASEAQKECQLVLDALRAVMNPLR